MPTILTHAFVGATIAQVTPATSSRRLTIAAAICAALPDLDVVTLSFGVPYGSMLGHRGLSHSLCAAAIVAVAASTAARGTCPRWIAWLMLFTATGSHGLLDALTDGGRGVAFFAPFSGAR